MARNVFVWLLAAFSAVAVHAAECAAFQRAESVWGEGRGSTNAYLRFSAAFDAAKVQRTGEPPVLRIAAATVYRAKLNGAYVGYGPARTAEGWAKVDEWPLDDVREGRNEIEIDVAGYVCESYQYVIQPAFLRAEVVQDGKVLAATSQRLAEDGLPYQTFTAAEIARDIGGAVYSRQRGFPGERYVVDPDAKPVAVPLVKAADVKLRPRAVPYPEFKVKDYFTETKAGPGKVWSAPFNDTGFIGFKVKVTEPGTFAVRFDEGLVDGKLDLFRNGDPSNSWHACLNHVTWNVKKPGEYVFETFEPYTFKFVEGRMESGKGEISAPYLRQFRNPLPEHARFESSDPDLDRIFRAACDTLAENGVDLYTDCPGRERSAWLCDTWFSASAAAYLTGDFGVERAFLENFVLAPRFSAAVPEGGMPGGYPGAGLLSTYMMWYVLQCGEYAARAGDDGRAFADFAKARVLRNIEFLTKYENSDGLLENLPGWVFIEWSHAADLVKGINYPANMLWTKTLDCAAALYGRGDFAERAERLRETIRRRSFDGAYFHDQELKGKDGRYELNPDRTETCQYYAFFTGVATKEKHPHLWRRMVEGFGPGRTSDGVFPSDMFFGRLLRLDLLARDGHAAKTACEIKNYLLGMAEESGTLWEFADGHDSRCHAFAAYAALLMVRDVVGLSVDHAHKTVRVLAADAPLSFCRVSLPVAEGEIAFTLSKEGAAVRRTVRLPHGWTMAEGSAATVETAEWITGSYVVPGEGDYAAHFEDVPNPVLSRAFTLAAKPVKRAVWRIASPGMYDASVNGKRVNAVALPIWTAFDRRVLEDEYDVTALVKSGANTLTLELGNGWWNPLPMKMWGMYNLRKTLAHGTPTAKATLEVEYADGTAERVVTDSAWRAGEGRVLRNNLYLGEKRDMRRAVDNAPSRPARTAEDAPKGMVLPRGEIPPVVVYDRWKAKSVKALPNGNWVVDMGVNFAGTIRATLRRTLEGDVVTFRYGELQYPNGTVNVMTGVCGQQKRSATNPPGLAEQKDTVICPAAESFVYEPRFTFHGFRYVEVAGLRGTPSPEDFEALAWSADVKDSASFECSDEKVNRLREVCRRTFRANLQGVQSDCPARERFGYGGDLAATAESFILNYDMKAFYRKVVRDRCDMEELHGVFTSTTPVVFPENGLKGLSKDYRFGWGVDAPILVDLLLRYYGDMETMREAYPHLRRFLSRCAEAFDADHVPPCIGDHEALEKADVVTTAQCHYHQFLKLTAKFARLLGETADAERFEATAKKLEAVFAAAARYVPAKGFVGNGRQGEECFAIYHKMLPPDDCDAAYGILRENVVGHEYALSTGIFSTQYLLEILLARGDAEIAGKVLTHKGFPGWFYMLDNGATTLWETWAPSDNTYSQNHPMFGSCAAWLMRGILGIQVAEDAVGCDKVRIMPHAVAGMTSASGWLDTPKGRITINWKISDGRMHVDSSVPDGIEVVEQIRDTPLPL